MKNELPRHDEIANASLLRIESLSVSYHTPYGAVQALQSVGLEVSAGQSVGVVGESGSGKSTIGLAILGLLPANATIDTGQICYRSKDLLSLSRPAVAQLRGNEIGMVFQDPLNSLTPTMKVGAQLVEAIRTHSGDMLRFDVQGRADELLGLVGIAKERKDDYPHQFSGGMRQRISIALSLSCNPKLLVLDEPTSALDVTTQKELLELLGDLRARLDLAIVLISHDLGVVTNMTETLIVLYAGRVVEQGLTSDVLGHPGHGYTKGLIAALPSLHGPRRTVLPSIPGDLGVAPSTNSSCSFSNRCPFASESDGCLQTQELRGIGASHAAACVRSAAILTKPWPVPRQGVGTVKGKTDVMLRAHHITKVFVQDRSWVRSTSTSRRLPLTVVALDDVSLEVWRGETLGLIGESGSGKSTLARILMRLVDPSSGSVEFLGHDLFGMRRAELGRYYRRVQLVSQNPDSSLNPKHRIGRILGRRVELHGVSGGRAVRDRCESLLEMVQLPVRYLDRFPHELSGGEKQRVAIARALAFEPSVVICDEPVSALDVSVRSSILNLLMELQASLGVTYLLIGHDLATIRHLCDRVAIMYRGVIREVDDTDAFFRPPHDWYTERLLSSVLEV